jgi:capsule polysaccharide modification protein KpsS
MHAPVVAQDEVRELDDEERAEIEAFIARFKARDKPIRAHRRSRVTGSTLRDFAGHVRTKLTDERDNEYLDPKRFVRNWAREKAHSTAIRSLYEPLGERPFVYFPLHVTDDYKIKRVIPHCVDQASIIELIAASLPQGVDLVLKEHPMSIGRNSLSLLRRLVRNDNVRLVDPYTSSHDLIRRARAVAVISSTVGLEALLHGRSVMTVGQPFYAGYGVTVDVDSFREIPDATQELLRFAPDRETTLRFLHAAMRRCYPGKPAMVDGSDENARALAATLHAAVQPSPDDAQLLTGRR